MVAVGQSLAVPGDQVETDAHAAHRQVLREGVDELADLDKLSQVDLLGHNHHLLQFCVPLLANFLFVGCLSLGNHCPAAIHLVLMEDLRALGYKLHESDVSLLDHLAEHVGNEGELVEEEAGLIFVVAIVGIPDDLDSSSQHADGFMKFEVGVICSLASEVSQVVEGG